jgi:hypothetical protein
LGERAEAQSPGMHVGDAQETVAAPGIVGEARHDVIDVSGADDQQDVGRAVERAAERHGIASDPALRGCRRSSSACLGCV